MKKENSGKQKVDNLKHYCLKAFKAWLFAINTNAGFVPGICIINFWF